MNFAAACSCNIGKIRSNNEDNFFFDNHTLDLENRGMLHALCYEKELRGVEVFAIFDGMGGESKGELASYIAAQEIKKACETGLATAEEVIAALMEANEKIVGSCMVGNDGMSGTTAVIAFIDRRKISFVNIGDSRGYLFRDGSLEQITTDHTDAAFLKENSISHRKPTLTQNLGIDPSEMIIEPSLKEVSIQNGDCVLMCTDGLTDMVPDDEIEFVLSHIYNDMDIRGERDCCGIHASARIVKQAVDGLVEKALEKGGKDNITVIAVNFFDSGIFSDY